MRLLFLISFLVCFSMSSFSQIEVNNTKTVAVIKASYIYNFAKSSKWDSSDDESSKFKIAVYGDKDIYEELIDKYSTRPINSNQTIEVIWVQTPEDLWDEHVVFVSKSKKSEIDDLAAICEENKSLLIADFDSALENGAVINFIVVDNSIGFDINSKQAKLNAIQLGNRIIDWANKIIE